jgi:hypothetical protein
MLTIPHFQIIPRPIFLLLDLLLCLLALYALSYAYNDRHFRNLNVYFVGAVTATLVLFMQLFTHLGFAEPYLLFSRFGSYTMFKDGKLAIFGDLSHLTSAVNCSRQVTVGENICDPWGRLFNQNPDVVSIFRVLNLSEVIALGILSTFVFSISFFLYSYRFHLSSLLAVLCFLSPVTVLAIDRGNETITFSLILFALILNSSDVNRTKVADILLVVAGIFKVWPFALLILIHFYRNRFKNTYSLSLLFCIFAYSIFHLKDFLKIGSFTQRGEITGNSFGLALFDLKNGYHITLLSAGFLLGILMIKLFDLSLVKRLVMPHISEFVFPLMAVYCLIWISGTHFAYRLLILFPIVAYLSLYPLAIRFSLYLVIVLLSIRLQSSPILTSSIFFIFIYFLMPVCIQTRISSLFNKLFSREK